MSRVDTLQRLAGIEVRSLVGKDENGQRILTYHYEACCTSRLLPSAGAADDVTRLHAIFDVALAFGLPDLIVDYIVKVCSDASLTSSEPLEAYLLDGECVGQWCNGALSRSNRRIKQALEHGLHLEDSGALKAETTRLEALVCILEALAPPGQPGAEATPSIKEARLLLQCAKVLLWAVEAGLAKAGACGRFPSRQEWLLIVNRRRDARQPHGSFLQDLLAQLQQHGAGRAFQYPPASVERAVEGLFLSGDDSSEAHRFKLATFLYYLLDAGHTALLAPFGASFGIPTSEQAIWQAGFLLDEASLQQPGSSALDTACSVLLEAAQADVPLKLVRALAELGRPEAALQLLRGRAQVAATNPEAALDEALTAVSILLSAGLVTEAFLQVRRHSSKVEGNRQRADTEALVSCLADWGAAAGDLGSIIQLPLLGLEEEARPYHNSAEPWQTLKRAAYARPMAGRLLPCNLIQALVAWLEEQLAESTPLAEFAVLFHLRRQRLPEALHAFARLAPTPAGSEAAGRRAALKRVLELAGRALPAAQASLVVHPPGEKAGLSLRPEGSQGVGPLAPAAQGAQLHVRGSMSRQPPLFGPLAESAEPAQNLDETPAAALPDVLPPSASISAPNELPQGARSGGEPWSGQGFGRVQQFTSAPPAQDWDSMMGIGGEAGSQGRRLPRSRRR